MEAQIPLESRTVIPRVGGPSQACGECGCSLFFKDCIAVCVAQSSTNPKFVYFCNEDHAKPYVAKHPNVKVDADIEPED